jgi:hypothetical protein
MRAKKTLNSVCTFINHFGLVVILRRNTMRQLNSLKGPLTSEADKMCKSKTSMRKLVLSGIVLACAMAGTVQADSLLATGVVYGGPGMNRVACEVVNMGTTPITFLTKQLVGQFNGNLPKDFDDCFGSLVPNGICTFQAAVGNQGVSCKVVIVQPKTNVRGTLQALSPLNNANNPHTSAPLSESDLR